MKEEKKKYVLEPIGERLSAEELLARIVDHEQEILKLMDEVRVQIEDLNLPGDEKLNDLKLKLESDTEFPVKEEQKARLDELKELPGYEPEEPERT